MVGVLSGYFLFGAFVDDVNPGATSWLNVYYPIAGLVFVAFLLLVLTPFDESASQIDKGTELSIASDFADMFRLFVRPLIFVFLICAFLYVLIEQSIMTWLPTFNSDVLNMSASLSIQMASILAASIALGRFLAGIILRKVHWYVLLSVCLCLAAILVIIVLPLAALASENQVSSLSTVPLAAFIFPMIGLCLAPISPAISSVILTALPKHQHATMSGLILIFSALGGTTGSMVTGTLFEIFDGKTAFFFSLVPIAALLYVLYVFKNQIASSGYSSV